MKFRKRGGLFIVIEGIDGSGKTTLAKRLCNFFEKSNVSFLYNFEPTKNSIFGIAIRNVLHKKALSLELIKSLEKNYEKFKVDSILFKNILKNAICKIRDNKVEKLTEIERQSLFIADRYFDLKNNIKPALKAGKVVVQDRFDISSAAYALGMKHISPTKIFDLQKKVLKNVYCIPDVKVFMNIDPKEAIKRIKRERKSISFYEDLKKLQSINKAYLKVLNFKIKEGKTVYYQVNPQDTKKETFQRVFKLIFPSVKSL